MNVNIDRSIIIIIDLLKLSDLTKKINMYNIAAVNA